MNSSRQDHAPSASLRRSADRLHVIISAPPGVLPAVRLRSVLEHELVALRALLFGHFASEEEGGYLADLVQAKPELLSASEELRAQHATLRDEFESLVQAVADAPLDALVERIGAALETFDAHEHAEAKLISGDLE